MCTTLPLTPHKTVDPTTCLIFLGIEIDTIALELHLRRDKLHNLQELAGEPRLGPQDQSKVKAGTSKYKDSKPVVWCCRCF